MSSYVQQPKAVADAVAVVATAVAMVATAVAVVVVASKRSQ